MIFRAGFHVVYSTTPLSAVFIDTAEAQVRTSSPLLVIIPSWAPLVEPWNSEQDVTLKPITAHTCHGVSYVAAPTWYALLFNRLKHLLQTWTWNPVECPGAHHSSIQVPSFLCPSQLQRSFLRRKLMKRGLNTLMFSRYSVSPSSFQIFSLSFICDRLPSREISIPQYRHAEHLAHPLVHCHKH